MSEFEEELNNLPVSIITNYGDYWNKAQLLTVFKDWQPSKPQQSMPVVPECVAEWYESHTQDLEFAIYVFCGEFYRDTSQSNKELSDFEKWFDYDENSPIETLICMKNGYQVEKQKLFYLRNKLTGMYLYKKPLGGYREEPTESIECLTDDFKFTQKEIDEMDVQGYDKED